MKFHKSILVATLLVLSTNANAAIIYSETFDANRLSTEAAINGDRSHSINGSSIVFGASQSSTVHANFMDISIFGSGVLSDLNQYTINISITENRALGSLDNDIMFAITTGNAYMGLQHSDNNGGRFGLFSGAITSGSPDALQTFDQLSGFNLVNTQMWNAEFQLGAIDSAELIAPASSGPFSSSIAMDIGSGLSFRVFGNDASEQYAFDSISITVEGPAVVPVPAAVWLFGTGMLGLFGMTRRKKISKTFTAN